MLKINYNKEINSINSGKLNNFLERISAKNQEFYKVIDDEKMVKDLENFAKNITEKYEEIVVLGIGGSALGSKTMKDVFLPKLTKNLHIIDNIDPDLIQNSLEKLNLKKVLFLVISKSGETPEVLGLYSFFRQEVLKKKLEPKNHFVFVSENNDGFLQKTAKKENIEFFSVPKNVSGRFSVLTNVGLLPAILCGVNIREILRGAKKMRDVFLNKNFEQNLLFQFASWQFENFQNGFTNSVIMPYIQNFKTFSNWYSQLTAESLGKISKNGKNTGITPISSLGVTDQHSLLQQFVQGIPDKQYVFIRQKKFANSLKIPDLESKKFDFLKNLSFANLLHTEMNATIETLTENSRPTCLLEMETLNEESLGELFMFFEGVTAFLGEFLNIETFNQPGVERSKILTREYLEKKT